MNPFANSTFVLLCAALFVFLAIPKKAGDKKSSNKKSGNLFGWIWAAVTFPFTVGSAITGIFTDKNWIKNIVGAVVLILFYLALLFWLRGNVAAAASLLP